MGKSFSRMAKKKVKSSEKNFYQEFLILKLALASCSHKKIVQKLFMKYLRIHFQVDFKKIDLGLEPKKKIAVEKQLSRQRTYANMSFNFEDCFFSIYDTDQEDSFFCKFISNKDNLKGLELNLSHNQALSLKELEKFLSKLVNLQSLKLNFSHLQPYILDEGMKYQAPAFNSMSELKQLEMNLNRTNETHSHYMYLVFINYEFNLKKLKILRLDLQQNDLVNESKSFLFLCEVLKKIQSCEQLSLNLCGNELNENQENMEVFADSFKYLSSLKILNLDLSFNDFGMKEPNMGWLTRLFGYLKKIRRLTLNLRGNFFGLEIKNLQNLKDGIENMENLDRVDLNLAENQLQSKEGNQEIVQQIQAKINRMEKSSLILE